MRKMILLASALALGGVAYAQDTAPAPMAQPDASAPADPSAQPMTPPPADASAPTDPSAAPAPAGDPSMAQPGMSGGATPGSATGPNGPVSMSPSAGPTDLPACSRTVTDNCKQGGGKAATHHRRKHK